MDQLFTTAIINALAVAIICGAALLAITAAIELIDRYQHRRRPRKPRRHNWSS